MGTVVAFAQAAALGPAGTDDEPTEQAEADTSLATGDLRGSGGGGLGVPYPLAVRRGRIVDQVVPVELDEALEALQ